MNKIILRRIAYKEKEGYRYLNNTILEYTDTYISVTNAYNFTKSNRLICMYVL